MPCYHQHGKQIQPHNFTYIIGNKSLEIITLSHGFKAHYQLLISLLDISWVNECVFSCIYKKKKKIL